MTDHPDHPEYSEQYTAETCPGRPCSTECDHRGVPEHPTTDPTEPAETWDATETARMSGAPMFTVGDLRALLAARPDLHDLTPVVIDTGHDAGWWAHVPFVGVPHPRQSEGFGNYACLSFARGEEFDPRDL